MDYFCFVFSITTTTTKNPENHFKKIFLRKAKGLTTNPVSSLGSE
jgi:hypothetical protein